MLCDRLVCGIGDDRILLSEPDLTFDKALELAQAMETASQDVKDLQLLEPTPSHMRALQASKMSAKLASSKPQHQHKTCYRCGSERHRAGDAGLSKKPVTSVVKVATSIGLKTQLALQRLKGVQYRQGSM